MVARALLAFAAIAAIAAFASSQAITVFIDGEPVKFTGIGPQRVEGRVLVPLRGVMEKLGAYVSYQASTRTVTATKGDIDLTLRIGERTAIVNGRAVTLDVPAQEVRGSTLVPLRFMSEMLGAEVDWNNATNTVQIQTGEGGKPPVPVPNPTGGAISIESFEVTAADYLRSGSRVSFALRGTPGGKATVTIPGVAQEITLREVTAGEYVGEYAVAAPAGKPLTVSRATAIASLKVGTDERLIQSSTALRIDTAPPTITATTPADKSRINKPQPNVTAVFEDQGSGIDVASVRLSLDDVDVTSEATTTSNLVVFRPSANLKSGRHTVAVSARDLAGNAVAMAWTFTIADNADVIKSFVHSAVGDIQPGDEILFTLVGEPGGRASASIGTKVRGIAMREVAAGKYEGTYVVRRTDRFEGEVVSVRFETAGGEVFNADSPKMIGEKPAAVLAPPKFTAPKEDARVSRRIIVTGTAMPRARVRLKIEFVQLVFGAIRTTGTVFEQELEAVDRGVWSTDEIDLDTGLGSGSTTYTATAVTLGAENKESEPAKLTFRR
jgi:hypothetical protein